MYIWSLAAIGSIAQRVPPDQGEPQKQAEYISLIVSTNKKQLIDIICSDLSENKIFHHGYTQNNKLVVTGSNNTPVQISHGVVIYREDISTSHEEADCIIVQQAMMASEYQQGVSVIADDTDVFILLIHHYLEQQLTIYRVMESPIHGRSVIYICSTVKNEEQIAHDLLACHALSGCDTVACYFGIGKVKALKNSESRLLFVMSM